ncbi:ATP-dependent Clp protease adapter protein ClpS [Kingella potus]|uniref:ATP-dependent Clp protease adapter protein ClpS n=1 Tax=Kingella potus TaxID=265175 RepID=A0A377QWY5_9NEIS|nr:ATP-dependent Clp protease adaptor ClpS [Kingella potus]UOP01776.1 ATP-dependent Clp protease adaptor ClpS [Kingella potus]STQ99914.1 ATP-dependent Clp protease adapter protein ClpS [Kingella potus]
MGTQHLQSEDGSALKLRPPRKYGVFLLNDDYTTMDFVVQVLTEVFFLPEDRAFAVMLLVHNEGRGLCGTYTRDVAQTKQAQVHQRAADAGFPLKCIVEEVS